jgi:hypothetical protein
VLKMPATVTSSAFSAPSVVLASSVRPLPGAAFRLRARPSPSITCSRWPDTSTRPADSFRNGPLMANSASGSMPAATITVLLSPLLTRPLKSTRGSTWRTWPSASSRERSAATSSSPCCSGTSSSLLNCSGRATIRWPLLRAAASARLW